MAWCLSTGELAAVPMSRLEAVCKEQDAKWLHRLSLGIDDEEVQLCLKAPSLAGMMLNIRLAGEMNEKRDMAAWSMQSVKSEHQVQIHSQRNMHLLVPYNLSGVLRVSPLGVNTRLDVFRLLRLAMPELISGSLERTRQAVIDLILSESLIPHVTIHLKRKVLIFSESIMPQVITSFGSQGMITGEAKEAAAVHWLREDVPWGERAQDVPQRAHLAGGAVQRAGGAHCRRPRGACPPSPTAHCGKPLCHTCS